MLQCYRYGFLIDTKEMPVRTASHPEKPPSLHMYTTARITTNRIALANVRPSSGSAADHGSMYIGDMSATGDGLSNMSVTSSNTGESSFSSVFHAPGSDRAVCRASQ